MFVLQWNEITRFGTGGLLCSPLSYYLGQRRIKNLGEYILHLRCKWVKIQQQKNKGAAASEKETSLLHLNFISKLKAYY